MTQASLGADRGQDLRKQASGLSHPLEMYNKAWREETTLCCKPPPRQERQLGVLHPRNLFGNKSDIPFLPPEEKHTRILK